MFVIKRVSHSQSFHVAKSISLVSELREHVQQCGVVNHPFGKKGNH